MAKFRCIASGNIMEFKHEVDIVTTRDNPAYEEVIEEVKKDIQEVGENPAVVDTEGEGVTGEPGAETDLVPTMSNPNFSKELMLYGEIFLVVVNCVIDDNFSIVAIG